MTSDPALLTVGDLHLCSAGCVLHGPAGSISLHPRRVRGLERLMRRAGHVVTQDALLSAVYPDPDDEPEDAAAAARLIVFRLRAAIAQVGGNPQLIRTVARAGWVFGAFSPVTRSYTAGQAMLLDQLHRRYIPPAELARLEAA